MSSFWDEIQKQYTNSRERYNTSLKSAIDTARIKSSHILGDQSNDLQGLGVMNQMLANQSQMAQGLANLDLSKMSTINQAESLKNADLYNAAQLNAKITGMNNQNKQTAWLNDFNKQKADDDYTFSLASKDLSERELALKESELKNNKSKGILEAQKEIALSPYKLQALEELKKRGYSYEEALYLAKDIEEPRKLNFLQQMFHGTSNDTSAYNNNLDNLIYIRKLGGK